jgi:fatty acid desaturase
MPHAQSRRFARPAVEWPTLALLAATCAAWLALTAFAADLGPWLAVPLLAIVLAQYSSLQHEALHGHPFRDQRLNDAVVFPALGLVLPYPRFRDTHLAHHRDPSLTDPYDDPESNYLDPAVWARLSRPVRAILTANNTLLGRLVLGPFVGMAGFLAGDLAAIRAGDRAVTRAWLAHLAGMLPVLLWLATIGTMPAWAYIGACWLALSILRIRTFLEHRAEERHGARSVIIEDRGPLALLFLNNNLHAVHHAHPGLAWYRLPGEYARRRDDFLRRNGGYRYHSYAEVFRRHFLHRKDPVAHPLYAAAPSQPGA